MSERFFIRSPAGLGWDFRESEDGCELLGRASIYDASVSLVETRDVPFKIVDCADRLLVDSTARNLASAVAAVLTEGDRLVCDHNGRSWVERAALGGLRLTRGRSA